MTADVSRLQVLLVTLAGWVNRHQQHVIEYLVEENRPLRRVLDCGHRALQAGGGRQETCLDLYARPSGWRKRRGHELLLLVGCSQR
jgi:hypothetical protein